jgi:hypothetical protein
VRVAGRRRTAWLTGVATVAAVLWLTGNFGVVDFVDGFMGFVDQARNQVLDVGWGAVTLGLGLGLRPRAREDPLTAGAPAPGG